MGPESMKDAGASPAKTTTTSLAPGFRFHPTDEELILYYLKRKIQKKPTRYKIEEIEIYNHEPWQLAAKSKKDEECYFFSAVDKKYNTGGRSNRQTKKRYWKISGKDREIKRGGENQSLIGMVKTLVFYKGRAPDGTRTNWLIHEYRLLQQDDDETTQADTYVLCKVLEKDEIGRPLKGNNYAPVVEEEWEDDDERALMISGENVKTQQENKSQIITSDDDEPRRVKDSLPPCVLNKKPPLLLNQYKRKRRRFNNSSQNSHQDSCSSTTTDIDASVSATLLEFSCSSKKQKPEPVVTTMVTSPSSSKVIEDLKNENHQIIVERETYKLDLMYAEMMVNMLQGKINALREENEKLRKNSNEDS